MGTAIAKLESWEIVTGTELMPMDAAMNAEIIRLLSPRIRDRSQIPSDFEELTVPVSIGSESILRSMWSSLESTECLITELDGAVVFWRRKTKSVRLEAQKTKGFVRTR